jgi:hypothetical protein
MKEKEQRRKRKDRTLDDFKRNRGNRLKDKNVAVATKLTVGVNDVEQEIQCISYTSSCNGFAFKVCDSHGNIWPLDICSLDQSIGSFGGVGRRPMMSTLAKKRDCINLCSRNNNVLHRGKGKKMKRK